ncbi:MAG: hypothetical protein ACI8RP_001856 [Urechidicola sp.]|jgi:hypothetical protein
MLRELGIVIGKETVSGIIFENLFSDFMEIKYTNPSDYIRILWDRYQNATLKKSPSVNGSIFEYILASLCIREEILPFYMGTKIAFVPNVDFDLMFYTDDFGPICWSAKTSLRERYKQADLEAIALKNVHRRALCYLITLDEAEARRVKVKIKNGDVGGLDEVILANSPDFDALIIAMKNYKLEEPPTVPVLKARKTITLSKVKSVFPIN